MLSSSIFNYNFNAVNYKQIPVFVDKSKIKASTTLDINQSIVNIDGVDKDALLYALWFHAKPQNKFEPVQSYDYDRAKNQLIFGYADIICGKIIKCDIYSSNYVDKTNYDSSNGDNMFIYIVNSLKYAEQ